MSAMGRVIFDEPAWWQRPQWQVVAAVVATITALAVWWAALAPSDPESSALPRAPNVSMAAAPPIERAAPLPATASAVVPPPPTQPARPAQPAQPARSTMVAPGVHVTPLSVPPGTEPVPADPREPDSNLEN